MPGSFLSQVPTTLAIMSFVLGCAVWVLSILLYRQHGHRAFRLNAVFLGSGLLIGGFSIPGLMGVDRPLWMTWLFGPLLLPALASLCISLPYLVLALLELKPPRIVQYLIWTPAVLATVFLGFQLSVVPQGMGIVSYTTDRVGMLLTTWFFGAWLASLTLLALRFQRITHPEVRQGLVGLGLILLLSIPYWAFEALAYRIIMAPSIFILLWCGYSLFLALRHFFKPLPIEIATAPPAPAAGPLADDEMLDRFAVTWGLTPRERELCAFLVEDLAYAGIAQHLFISEKTVRNHVSNIYTKVGVASRLELIRAIRGV